MRGPINDVNNVEKFLLNSGFSSDNIVKLTDDQRVQRAIPTRQNILDAIQWLVKDAKPNDSLFSIILDMVDKLKINQMKTDNMMKMMDLMKLFIHWILKPMDLLLMICYIQ